MKTVPVGLSAAAYVHRMMRALNYLEAAEALRGGMVTATNQQRAALETTDVEVVETPWRAGDPVRSIGSLAAGGSCFTAFDVAHCNLVGPGSVAVARHARRTDTPLVLHAHLTREDFAQSFRGSSTIAPALEPYLRWFYSQADLVLCPSEYTKDVLRAYPVDAPIRQLSNGVDLESMQGYESFRADTRARFDLDGTVVYAVGEVFERKGLTMFCELAKATDHEFAWFGPYDEGPQAGAATRKWVSDPPANVTFTGYMEDKRAAFGAGDIYLFPAKVENQGIAVLEAMACGKPVVLRDIPVFREFFTDGEDCLMCSTFEAFRDAIDRLAGDPELRTRLGENARETAESHSLDRIGEELASIYECLRDGDVASAVAATEG
ncbi:MULTISPECIES: glycosyltransferase family 4 protein [Halobacterium]|nr:MULTISPECIES: glycosyltransferase family 4 protein [Halobacterium]MDL0121294.1 glycosyltransferase family 4 protein [Halobacterium salinarum]MDL0126794.1 glycosyltransferase family 4 protein [Halobacterium salinarum]MDL0132590.1 glycosyltransferase family 4 protein [Halobacterium salinarum]QRY25254.2 glycosyltransferase family 4 protein [Halobacterium sp. BOL4-2]